ncbi:DUF2119 domain-containing protein [Methanosarcina sp.]|uniref:DUF2119 domain-containing protein n=1 Tax=Methanosarcina sp. TaxID=2213 RepID=UPI003BB5CC43
MKSDGIKSSLPDESIYIDLNSDSSSEKLDSSSEKLDSSSELGIRIYGRGKPVRLFVAGLHGEEWKDTTEILKSIMPPKNGTLALIPLVSNGKYISTLDPAYYPSTGKKILESIEKLKPEIYIELHSYAGENIDKLAGNDRLNRVGVPAYSVLKEGVLLGSVSPWIRKKYFPKEALCLSFEVRKESRESRKFAASMLEVLKEIQSRDEFIEYLKTEFPLQAKKAIEDYRQFYGEI